ncbi:YadA-like family protein [Gallibacterium anatis]|uniref:Uncharacterized protein n=1 Tax=Gallibacterium anatis TaxID=750 RepID=A0A0A2Y0P8_9PAST|nr:YadA-like family protein [Gallibacterium anatis]KGQ31109.1 hypothetical protein JP32_07220 [Gallibacterium anatis]
MNPVAGKEYIECTDVANESVIIGINAKAYNGGTDRSNINLDEASGQTVVGKSSTGLGQQATILGYGSGARGQATAIGNDVFANGVSSIAIGSDDLVYGDASLKYGDRLPTDTINSVFSGLKNASQYWSQQRNSFDQKYTGSKSIYSPTYAAKLGAIAIGSRAVAGGEVSTSVGSLSFALADRSTAMGIRTFVAQDAVGGTAIGEQSRVFAPNSIAMGNYTESAAQGSFSYGYNAKAIGQGALAFGYDSAAGAKINGDQYTKLLGFTRGLHALDLFKADGSIDDEKVKQFYAGVDTLIKGGDVNGTQFGGVAQMFTDETLFEKDKSKEYLNIGGKSIYKTATSTSTATSSDAAENAFAMGRYAFALRSNAMAFGYSTIADAQSSLAIGSFAHTDSAADNSIAFGVNTYAAGRNNFVAGYSSRSYANDSMALGVGSYIGQGSANSTAIGKVAKVKENTTNGMAIGNYSEASINNSVALGVNSKTDYDPEDLNLPGWVAKGAIAVPTSATTGIISVGGINNERRITNVASGYADTDAANVAQLRTIDEKFDTRIDSLENGGGVQYQSIDKSNAAGEAAKLAEKLSAEKDYKQYVTLEKQWIGFKAREILNGEQINEASLKAMRDKADALNKDGRFDSLSTELKTLKEQLLKETKAVDKTKYDQYVTDLGNAFDKDSVKSPGNYTPEQIAELKKGTNYDNDGAQGADSIAFGWKAKTNASGKNAIALGVEAGGENGVSGEDGIAIGTKSKVSGKASIAMGKDNNVSGNNSIAVGTALTIAGNNAGAFGDPSTINYDNSYSVGNNNTIGTATTTETEKGSFVVGNNVEVSADNVFVLGSGESSDNKLKASQANSVYLGAQSNVVTTGSAGATNKYEQATIGGQTFGKFAGSTPVGVVTVGNDNQTRRVQGVAAGLIAENSTDAINGSQLFATNTYLTNLAEKIGINGENGINGVDGANGPSGQDGLNGQSLANKVQALRDGLAGTVVYTDAKGVRVMSEDGEYYYPETLTKDMKKANDGLWYAASNVNADGTVTEAGKNSGKKLSELDGAYSHKLDAGDVILSAVNATGNTTTPISVSNLASVLGAIPTTAEAKFSDAKAKVGALLAGINPADKDKEPEQQTKVDLDRAATAADLQVLAQAGLAFQGNDEAVVNRALSQTLSIKGEGVTKDNYAVFQSASGNIVVGKDTSEGSLVVKLAKDLNNIHSIGAGATTSADAARITFTDKSGAMTAPEISVNNAKLKQVADGVDDSDAVNMSQLSAVKKSITDLQTASNSASIAYKVTNSKGVSSDGGKTPLTTGFNFTSLSDNIEISKGADNGGQIKFNLKDQLTGISSIKGPKTSSTPLLITLDEGILTLSGSGTKNGAQIKGVLKGVDDTDAVNMAQLKTMATTVGAKVGSDGEITAPTFDTAVKGSGTNNTAPESLKDAVDDLITANNKGLTFSDGKNTTTKYFGDTLVAKSADLSDTAYKGKNLKTEVKDGNLLLAMKDKPEFAALALKAGNNAPTINLTPNTDANKPAISLSSGTDGNSKDVVLNGIAAGTADNSAVNLAQLNNLRNLIGVGKDGSNGVNGVDGVDGKNGTPAIGQQGVPGKDGQNGQSFVGPAGQDGLNGTTVINKVQALRDGVAGTMVYTDTAGNRLIAENGTFYKTDLVDNYAKANDGLWYAKDKVNADGSVATNVAGQGKSLKELATLAGNEDLIAKSNEVILSAVNADGQTMQPITIANLKDNLVVAEVTTAEQANAENLAKAANGGKDLTDEQKAAVAKALKEQKVNATVASLLANTNDKELSRAVTLRDLQTVAQAGLSFAGNDSNNPIHQALGTTLLIQGKSGATYSEAVYSADNLITRNDNGTLRIEMKKTPTFDGIILDGKGQDGKDGKDGYIGVDAEGNVVVKNGVDGLAGKDGKDGVDGTSKVLTEGSVNASAQLTYKAEGQGYTDKDGQKVDKPTVSLADGLNFKGDSNIKTAVNANGEVDITLNKDLTVDSIGGGEGKGKLSFEANNTINANNSRITGIADGKNRGDAVNKGQMDDAIGAVNTNINNIKNEVVNKGMNFATSNDDGKTKSTQTAKLGDTVVVKAGANVDVSEVREEAEGTFSYTISVKGIPMTYVDADGKPLVQVGDDFYHLQENGAVNFASTATPAGVKVVKDTTKLNDKAVANDQLSTVDVANGEIKNGSQQAVTGGQVADLLGVTVDKDGKVKDGKSGENGIGGTGKNTVSEAISETVKIAKSGNTEVKAGKNVIVTKGTGTNGTTAYTVSMDTSNLEVEKLILGKGDNKTTISVVNQSQYQGSEKAIDVGGTRITNVKDGIDPTDAVNVGQMNKLANATSKAINNVNRRVDHLTQESRAGIAGAMATAGLQQSTERGRTTVSVGSAVFKGESAVALGLSKLSDSGKVGIRISGMTTSNGDTGGSVSVGYTW